MTRSGLAQVDGSGGLIVPDHVDVPLLGAAPAAPATGKTRLYLDSNGILQLVPAAAGPSRRIGHHWGSGAVFPASGMGPGDSFLHTAYGLHFYNGTAWRQRGPHELTAAQRTALATVGLYDGYEVYETDTTARARWDATAGVWLLYDAKWQTFTPRLATTNATNYYTLGNGTVLGRYFRKGREISYVGAIIMGSTTTYTGGLFGTIQVEFPTGLLPAYALSPQTMFGTMIGVAGIHSDAFYNGFANVLNTTGAANARRLGFISSGASAQATGTGNGWNMSAANHGVTWSVSYETAFEA